MERSPSRGLWGCVCGCLWGSAGEVHVSVGVQVYVWRLFLWEVPVCVCFCGVCGCVSTGVLCLCVRVGVMYGLYVSGGHGHVWGWRSVCVFGGPGAWWGSLGVREEGPGRAEVCGCTLGKVVRSSVVLPRPSVLPRLS